MAELGGILGVVHVAAMVSHDCATHQALKNDPYASPLSCVQRTNTI